MGKPEDKMEDVPVPIITTMMPKDETTDHTQIASMGKPDTMEDVPVPTMTSMMPKDETTDHTRCMSLKRWPSESSILSKLTNSHVCHLRWSRLDKAVTVNNASSMSGLGLGLTSKENNSNVPPSTPVQKKSLSKVSGCAAPGELLAIMGPRGSGKTTLLNVLSGRTGYGSGGTVSVSGIQIPPGSSTMNKFVTKLAYVKKTDIFLEHLTIRDHLLYTALLKLPHETTKSETKEKVEKIIRRLDLSHVADSPIHILTLCERRRVSIGTELLPDPCCIFLDEPTRGLDSISAGALIKLLQRMAQVQSKTIIMTIHQPSSMLFHKFDKVLMLAEGHLVYFGSPKKSVQHLEHHGMILPEGYTDAEYWTHLLESGISAEDAAAIEKGELDESQHDDIIDSCDEVSCFEEMTFSGSSHGSEMLTPSVVKPSKLRRCQSVPVPRTVGVPERMESIEVGFSTILPSKPRTAKRSHSPRKKKVGPPPSMSPLPYLIHVWDDELMAARIDMEARRPSMATEFSKGRPKSTRTSWAVFQFDQVIRSSIRGGRKDEQSSSPSKEGQKDIVAAEEDHDEEEPGEANKRDHHKAIKFKTTWWTQYDVLLHRALKNSRSATFTRFNLIKTGILGLLVGMAYFQRDYSEVNVFDISSYCYITQAYFVLVAMFEALSAFPSERQVVLKERANHSYHLSAYFLAKMTSELPIRMVLPLIYSMISFWMAGMSSRLDVFLFTPVVALLGGIVGEAIGLVVGTCIYDGDRAMSVLSVLSIFMLLVGGFLVQNIPDIIGWIRFLSPFKYSYDASCLLMFDTDIPCDGSGALGGLCDEETLMVSAKDVLDYLNVEGTLRFNVGLLLLWAIIPRYLAYRVMRSQKESEY